MLDDFVGKLAVKKIYLNLEYYLSFWSTKKESKKIIKKYGKYK